MNIKFTEVGPDFLTATMPVVDHTMQPFGILHGGASCALAETVGSAAGALCVDLKNELCVGLEIDVNHLKMVSSGFVKATAFPIHIGKKTHVWEIKIYAIEEKKEKLCAISRLTLMVIEKRPSS